MTEVPVIAVRPGHWANTGLEVTDRPLPVVDGVALDVAADNVGSWGGNPRLFGSLLRACLTTGSPTGEQVRGLAVLAAWRCGVSQLRAEALRVLPELPPDAAAAALALSPSDLDAFADHQRSDRYWWPGRAAVGGWVLQVGGFSGIGGPWISPPVTGGSTDVPGRWVIRADERWWQLDADAFGSRLVVVDHAEPGADTDPAGIRMIVTPASYLVALTAPAEWKRTAS